MGKKIVFNLSNKFKLIPVTSNRVYELENNSCRMEFKTLSDDYMVYELHIEKEDGSKYMTTLERDEEKNLYIDLSSSMLSKSGILYIQLRGIKNDGYVIESNKQEIQILTFINATGDIPPEQETVVEKLLAEAQALKVKADILETLDVTEIDKGINVHYEDKDYQIVNGKDGKDGKDGVDGKTPVKGVDYFTDSEIEAIVNQPIDILMPEIGQVASDLEDETTARLRAEASMSQELDNKPNKSDVYTKEQSNALLDGKANSGTVEALNTNLRAEIAKKQNILTAGENITIVNNVISATGGGGTGDVTKEYLAQNYYDKLFFEDTVTLETTGDNTTVTSADIVYEGLVNASKVLSDSEKLKIETWLGLSETYLTMYNATPYQVNGNYVPAHKKYVDEHSGLSLAECDFVQTLGVYTGATTPIYINENIAIEVEFTAPEYVNDGCIIGTQKAQNGIHITLWDGQWCIGTGDYNYVYAGYHDSNRNKIIFNKNGKVYFNDTEVATITNISNNEGYILLGCRTDLQYNLYSAKYHRIRIYDSRTNELLYDFKPVKTGFYDANKNYYFTSDGLISPLI